MDFIVAEVSRVVVSIVVVVVRVVVVVVRVVVVVVRLVLGLLVASVAQPSSLLHLSPWQSRLLQPSPLQQQPTSHESPQLLQLSRF